MRIVLILGALALAACNSTTTATTSGAETPTPSSIASASSTATGEAMPAGTPSAADAKPGGETFPYACRNHVSFSVRFDPGTVCAFVNAGGQTYRLGAAISGSGARYSDGHTQYWDHHGA